MKRVDCLPVFVSRIVVHWLPSLEHIVLQDLLIFTKTEKIFVSIDNASQSQLGCKRQKEILDLPWYERVKDCFS
jgi:hypothetical protein